MPGYIAIVAGAVLTQVAALAYIALAQPGSVRASFAIWAAWFLAFVAYEVSAAFDAVPWNTLSWTSWELQSRNSAFSIAFLAGLFVLLIHIAFRFPNKKRYQPPQGDEH